MLTVTSIDEWALFLSFLQAQLRGGSIWKTRTSILEALEIALDFHRKDVMTLSTGSVSVLYELIFHCLDDAKYTTVREAALKVLTLVFESRRPPIESVAEFNLRLDKLIVSEPSILIADGLQKIRSFDHKMR